jgi:diguanylate cyclase (GGDEF)-like protein/PAS domain S-box-containing protein
MSLENAVEELENLAGKQFDPDVVMTFAQVARNFDAEMRAAVQSRWMHFGFDHSVVELFSHSANRHTNGVIDNSINTLFHRRLADHMNDGVIFIDTEGKILEWNRAAENITGCSRSSICHLQWKPELIDIHDESGRLLSVQDCPLLAVMRTGGYEARRLSLKHCDGSRRAIQIRVLPVNDDQGTCRGAAMVFDDITRQKNLEQAVEKLHIRASKDQLTKVNNRAELNLQLPKLTKDVHEGHCLASVIICDIDYFKRINDTYGHAAGDEALVAFASILQQCSRATDLVARYGGEEFVILCRDCTLDDACRKAEEIRHAVSNQPLSVIRGKSMTASFGVAEITSNTTGEKAINAADVALLRAKANGRNRVERTESARNSEVKEPKPAPETKESRSNSWLSWLSINSTNFKKQVDIIVTVPPELAIEKLRGFLDDWHAHSVNFNEGLINLVLDLRKAPAYMRSNDRDISLQMEIQIRSADYLPKDQRESASQRTLITATLKTTSKRDRRVGNIDDLMQHVFVGLNRYLVGEILDAESRKCIRIHSRQ